ncbi:MAG: PVC-type heme-binding CxxCH protein [Planctomycetota bacterium]
MPRILLSLGLFCVCLLPAFAGEVQLNGHKFTLPDGFQIELVATSPLVDRPITADFDELGRLYVADSSGSNDPVQKQLEDKSHRIVRLQDTDGDGKFDKSIVFADKMMFPEGTLWYDGSLYVAAPPSIWKLTDTDGDGVADKREEWFAGKTLTGCANDLHGPYLGPDGWIYWCKGAFAEQTYEQPGKKPLTTKASHIFRRRADGTGPIENVMTGGMDNPVDVVFTPGGERLFTTTFLQNPGGGLRDGMIHAVYGGVYGKVHNVTDFHPRTGDLLPPLVHMGAAAPCGLARYESDAFGEEFLNNVFACQFNMHKVSRHTLKPRGATFESTDSDLVVSDHLDFHPTDVIEDADGSVIVCDTGGWYKLCCPTSQLAKPDVIGAVYRIRRTAAARIEDPRGIKIDWAKQSSAELTALLSDKRPAVQHRAIHLLGQKGADAVASLKPIYGERRASDAARLNGIWALTRIDLPAARELIREALSDPSPTVQQAALQSVSLWRDRSAMPQVVKLLQKGDPQHQRLAAEILGRLEDKSAVPHLLEAAGANGTADRFREHGITYALIEIADALGTAEGLKSPNPTVQRLAMVALDQMPGGRVEPTLVVGLLSSPDSSLRETALWLVGRHPEWGDALAGYLRQELARSKVSAENSEDLIKLLARFSGTSSVQELIASQLRTPASAEPTRPVKLVSLMAMQRSGLKQLPDSWIAALTAVLATTDDQVVTQAIAVVRAVPIPKTGGDDLVASLRRQAAEGAAPAERRIEALAALPATGSLLDQASFTLLLSHLGEQTSVATRSAAVEALTRVKLSVDQQATLATQIAGVGPLELNRLLGLFETATDESVGRKLIASLKESPILTKLRVDMVKQRLAKFPPAVQQEAEPLYLAINVEAGKQKQRLDELSNSLSDGDVRRGQQIFHSSKAACSACHAIGYLGGTIGPDLSRIGKIRTERDLLESLLYPSVSFVRSYEPVLIVTKSGKSISGLVRRETADEITMATGAKEEVRIARDDIEEVVPGTVSIMPAGLETQFTREQLADLVAFLKSRQ